MNRNARLALVLTVALSAAGVASFGVYRVVAAMPVREVEVASLEAVVAARSIPVGTIVTKDHVKLVPWPRRNPVPGSFAKIDDVLNRGAIVQIAENEPLTESKLAALGVGGGLPPTIPEGMRAISVKTNEVVGVAGFVVPGTRVDVVVVLGKNDVGEPVSRAVVSNVQVLTAGNKFDQEKAKEGEAIPARVVTLLVTPEDAERVSLAASEGQIVLTLRNPLDVAPTTTSGVRMSNLLAPPGPPVTVKQVEGRRVAKTPPPPPTPAPPAPKIYTVEAIRAAKRTEEPVK